MHPYYILYAPQTFNFMDQYGRVSHPNDLLSFLSGIDAKYINANNYLEYLYFHLSKLRKGMADALAIECYTLDYIGNMIAKCGAKGKVILADGKRRTLQQIIQSGKPRDVVVHHSEETVVGLMRIIEQHHTQHVEHVGAFGVNKLMVRRG